MNYYRTLGVPFTATRKEIKAAFRRLAKECHPDLHPNDPDAERRFKALNQAYETLFDPSLRRKYHQQLARRMKSTSSSKAKTKPFTQQEKAAFYAAMREEQRMMKLRRKIMIFGMPTFTVIIYIFLVVWAWNHGMLNWQYGIIMFIASAFLAFVPSALTFIASFWFLRKKGSTKNPA